MAHPAEQAPDIPKASRGQPQPARGRSGFRALRGSHAVIPCACLVVGSLACRQPEEKAGRIDRWEPQIAAFEQADRDRPPPANAVLFVGSSSVRLWKDLSADFPGIPVINRGFGGSSIPDCTRYVDRIIAPYRPRLVVLYAGDNDIAAGRSPRRVFEDYKAFVRRVRSRLPDVPIAFISIKPSPARASRLEAMREANDLIRCYAATHRGLLYIDVFTPMLDPAGRPRADLFGPDRLHLNRKGYELWRGIVAPYLQ